MTNVIKVNFQVVANEADLDEMDDILDQLIEATQQQCDQSRSTFVKQNMNEILDALIDCRVDIQETKEEMGNV